MIASGPTQEFVNNYRSRIIVPLEAEERNATEFRSASGLLVATGYRRVVVGKRGPYVEFELSHFGEGMDVFVIPGDQRWRKSYSRAYYIEWRTIDECRIKMYQQKRLVEYADYQIGLFYISPGDLYVVGEKVLITTRK